MKILFSLILIITVWCNSTDPGVNGIGQSSPTSQSNQVESTTVTTFLMNY